MTVDCPKSFASLWTDSSNSSQIIDVSMLFTALISENMKIHCLNHREKKHQQHFILSEKIFHLLMQWLCDAISSFFGKGKKMYQETFSIENQTYEFKNGMKFLLYLYNAPKIRVWINIGNMDFMKAIIRRKLIKLSLKLLNLKLCHLVLMVLGITFTKCTFKYKSVYPMTCQFKNGIGQN